MADSLSVMMQKEQTVYQRCDYLSYQEPSSTSPRVVDEDVRTTMVDWCYSFIDVCQFDRENVAIAMEMVDRFLSKSSEESEAVLRDRMKFQLLTMTSLYVTFKTYGRTALAIDFISSISQDLYTVQEIEAMEWTLLNELSWCISAPTCVHMAHHILTLISMQVPLDKPTRKFIRDEMNYQAEYIVRDYYFVTQRPSTMAIATMLNALDLLSKRQRNCRNICRALVTVMNDEFDSIEKILDMKSRLFSLVYEHEAVAGDDVNSYRQVDEFM